MKLNELQEVLDFAEHFGENFNMEQSELILEILTENQKPVEEKPVKKRRERSGKRILNRIIKKAVRLRKKGASYSEISKTTGMPLGSIGRVLKKAGAI